MKIKEFIEKVNEHDGMQAKKIDKRIAIGTPNNMGIFSIPEDATNFIEIDTWATSNRLYWKKEDREYLSALIEEFLHTPVEERFPEKKYRLRWIDDKLGKTFLGFNNQWTEKFWSTYGVPTSNTIFTESELEQLKKDNPHLAPAIDAMKEPAEDKDE